MKYLSKRAPIVQTLWIVSRLEIGSWANLWKLELDPGSKFKARARPGLKISVPVPTLCRNTHKRNAIERIWQCFTGQRWALSVLGTFYAFQQSQKCSFAFRLWVFGLVMGAGWPARASNLARSLKILLINQDGQEKIGSYLSFKTIKYLKMTYYML